MDVSELFAFKLFNITLSSNAIIFLSDFFLVLMKDEKTSRNGTLYVKKVVGKEIKTFNA